MKRIFSTLLLLLFVFNPAFSGGLHFGPIQAIKSKIGEYNANIENQRAINGLTNTSTLSLHATIGNSGTGNGEFKFSDGGDFAGLYVTSSYVLVCDNGNSRVQNFDVNNNFNSWLGTLDGASYNFYTSGTRDTGFIPLCSPFVAPSGNIYIHEALKIDKFSSAGVLLSSWAVTASNFRSFCVDTNENVFIFANDGDTIEKYNSTGTLITTFGGFGSVNGKFNNTGYQGILSADSNNNIYATDTKNHRIQVFDNDGVFLKSWTDALINGWHSMCIDENNNIYIGSYNNFNKYSINGTIFKQYSLGGLYIGTIVGTFVRSNKLYVVDNNNDKILIYSIPE